MSERIRLQRKPHTSAFSSAQSALVPSGSLTDISSPTPSTAPAVVTKPDTQVPSRAFRGHDFRRVAPIAGMTVNRSYDPAEQKADWAAVQKLQMRQSAALQSKPIQPYRGFNFRQVSPVRPGQGLSDCPSNSIQHQGTTETISQTATQSIQPKLTIGQPNDQYEQEADHVAAQVMNMSDAGIQQPIQRETAPEENQLQTKPLAASITPLIQQETLPKEAEVQAKCEACEQEEQIQRSSSSAVQAQSDLESQLNGSKGGGSPLPDDVRSFMEPRFGADFSEVRVHTNSAAVQMNRDLNAQAFTHGSDIYYGGGKAPGNNDLTAHELTHVVQQTGEVQIKLAVNNQLIQRQEVCDDEGVCWSEPDSELIGSEPNFTTTSPEEQISTPVQSETEASSPVMLPEIVIVGEALNTDEAVPDETGEAGGTGEVPAVAPNDGRDGAEGASGVDPNSEPDDADEDSSSFWNDLGWFASGAGTHLVAGEVPGGFIGSAATDTLVMAEGSQEQKFWYGAGAAAAGAFLTVQGGIEMLGGGLAALPSGGTSLVVAGHGATAAAAGVEGLGAGLAMMSGGPGDRRSRGRTEHGEQRAREAREGDTHRQVGDPNKVVRQGRRFRDSDTGYDVYVDGDRVVILTPEGRVHTQFINPRANTQRRIQSGKWIPQ